MNITIEVPESTMKDIEIRLDGVKKPNSVIKTAVNNTAKDAQKILAAKVAKEYAGKAAKKGTVMSASEIIKASTSKPVAIIKFRSSVHEIKEFHVSSLEISKTTYRKDGKRGGRRIKGNVIKGTSKKLKNAFVVRFKNGHISVVRRVEANGGREKLKKLLSPSYPALIGGERVYGAVSEEIAEKLNQQIAMVIDKTLGGRK